MSALEWLGDPDNLFAVIMLACLPAVNLYPFVYLFRPWHVLPQGRALMIKAWGNLIVIDMFSAALIFGDYPYREQVRVLGIALFCLGINYLFWTLMTSPGAKHYPPFSWFSERKRDERNTYEGGTRNGS